MNANSNTQIKIGEVVIVLLLSFPLGIFVALDWKNSILNLVSTYLFELFLPSISIVIVLFGGFHQANEFQVTLGVVLQLLLLWLVFRFILKKINRKNMHRTTNSP